MSSEEDIKYPAISHKLARHLYLKMSGEYPKCPAKACLFARHNSVYFYTLYFAQNDMWLGGTQRSRRGRRGRGPLEPRFSYTLHFWCLNPAVVSELGHYKTTFFIPFYKHVSPFSVLKHDIQRQSLRYYWTDSATYRSLDYRLFCQP